MNHLSQDELLAVLKVAREASERDWLAILLGYNHGLRISEVCALTVSDVSGGFISVKRLKGSLPTTHPLVHHSDPLLDESTAVAKWIQGKSEHERIVGIERSMLSKLFTKYCWKAGLPKHKRHFHCLKHSITTSSRSPGSST